MNWKALVAGGAGPVVAMMVAGAVVMLAPTTSVITRVGGGSASETGAAFARGAAMTVLAFGGNPEMDGKLPLLTLVLVSAITTYLVGRKLVAPAWPTTPAGLLASAVPAAIGALAAILLGGVVANSGAASASFGWSLLFAPLVSGAAACPWDAAPRTASSIWTTVYLSLGRGLLTVAGLSATVWMCLAALRLTAWETALSGISPVSMLLELVTMFLVAVTVTCWAALALIGVPVSSGTFGSPLEYETTNTLSAFSGNVPTPVVILLAIAIVAVIVVLAATVLSAHGPDPSLWWRLPVLVGPCAALLALISSGATPAGAPLGASWDQALIIGTVWAALLGCLCHPAIAQLVSRFVPALSGVPVARERIAVTASVVAGLLAACILIGGIIQSRLPGQTGAFDQFAQAYRSGDPAAMADVTGRQMIVGTPNSVGEPDLEQSEDGLWAKVPVTTADGPFDSYVMAVPQPERVAGIFVTYRASVSNAPLARVKAADGGTVPRSALPEGMGIGGVNPRLVRYALPGSVEVTYVGDPDADYVPTSDSAVVHSNGHIPIEFEFRAPTFDGE